MAVGDAYVFPGFLTPVLTLLFFQSHRLLFSHASAEVRGENTPERKVASTWDRTHNHQVMSPTRSPLSHPGGSQFQIRQYKITVYDKRNQLVYITLLVVRQVVRQKPATYTSIYCSQAEMLMESVDFSAGNLS